MRNKRATGRMNAVDFVLLVLLFLSVSGIGLRAVRSRTASFEGVPTEVYAVWRATDRRTAGCLVCGEILRTAAGAEFGEVVALRTADTIRTLQTDSGTLTGTVRNDPLCDVYLTVRVRLTDTDGVARRENGQPLAAGASYELFGERTRLILSVLRVGEGNDSENAFVNYPKCTKNGGADCEIASE